MQNIRVVLYLLVITLISKCSSSRENNIRCDVDSCKLPICKCSSSTIPDNVDFEQTPMMIALTFSGAVNRQVMEHLKHILQFTKNTKIGCPIMATFFVADTDEELATEYCLIQNLFDANNEIAIGARISNKPENELVKDFINGKKNALVNATKISKSLIKGFRELDVVQQKKASKIPHFMKSLEASGFEYDSSVVVKPEKVKTSRLNWPSTLQFKPEYKCNSCEISNLWEMPINYLDINGPNPCPVLIRTDLNTERRYKKCAGLSHLTKEIVSEFLMDSFKLHYINKAPMVINIDTKWLITNPDLVVGSLTDFIVKLEAIKERDFYFLTISEILDWIERPGLLKASANRWLWSCDDAGSGVDNCLTIRERLVASEKLMNKQETKSKKSKIDLTKGEKLFPSHVINYVIFLFTGLVILTVGYDKFFGSSDTLRKDQKKLPPNETFIM